MKTLLIGIAAIACAPLAQADVIFFDDAYAAIGDGGDPNDFYATPLFIGPFFGVVGGLGNGDPGNWDLEGTNGSAFWGFNVDVSGGIDFFDDVTAFSLDVSRSAGSNPGQTFMISYFDDGELVFDEIVTLGEINDWTTLSFDGTFDRVAFQGSQNGFSPFGIDNIQFEAGAACFADCDGNGALNILDFVCYQGLFQSGDEAADCDGNGDLNILDFVCFQGAFQDGCD